MCGHQEEIEREAFLESLDRAIAGLRSAFIPGLAAILPTCSVCHGPARPDFVAFGEDVRGYEEAKRLVREARALLVVGTSGEVFPAALLPEEARSAGAVVVEVATGPTSIEADLRVEGPAGTVLTSMARSAAGP
jgi:NAD-dependent deacetylase